MPRKLGIWHTNSNKELYENVFLNNRFLLLAFALMGCGEEDEALYGSEDIESNYEE